MKSAQLGVLYFCLVAVTADGLRSKLDRELKIKNKKRDVFDSSRAAIVDTTTTSTSTTASSTSNIDKVVQGVGDTAKTTLMIQLKTNEETLDGPTVICTNPYDSTITLALWDFIRVSAELEGSYWLRENGIMDDFVLPDKIIDEGPILGGKERRLVAGERASQEEHRSLWYQTGYYYHVNRGSCGQCSPDDTDTRKRKLGDSEGSGFTFTDAIAKSLKQLLKKKCTKMLGLAHVTFSPVVDES